jgi:DNA repair protein RecO (recombination protein O)
MKQQIVTRGIVLSRRDYQEADRILHVLTPDNGRVSLIAKGVRRPKSKMAGGIELFTINELTYLPGKSDIKTLISSRMSVNYGNIVKDIQRTMTGYDLIKQLNRYVEDEAGQEYFDLLAAVLEGLNDADVPLPYVETWFALRLLQIAGHSLNLNTDTEGSPLSAVESYLFDFDSNGFQIQAGGLYNVNHLKLLRLIQSLRSPVLLKQVQDAEEYIAVLQPLGKNLLRHSIDH